MNTYSELGNMEEQNCENALQFSPLANWIAHNASGLVDGCDANQHRNMTHGRNEINQVPVAIPEWMQCQQAPQNYGEFLAESGYSEIKKGMSDNMSSQVSSLELADHSQVVEEYLRLHYERNLCPIFTGMEHQFSVQKQDCNQDYSNAFQAYTESGAAALKYPSKARRRRSREKSYAADRCRRLRISQWLDALQELLPHPKEGSETLLDNVIDHINHLQYQMKELCQSRLVGELTSNSFIFLEGHGHYLVNEQMLNGPLEEMMGEFLKVNPSAATELLHSRGLIVMPTTFVEELCEPTVIQDMQNQETKQRSVAPSGL